MGWEATDDFINNASDDVKGLVAGWQEMYGADLYACCQMLRDMSSVIYQPDDDAESRPLQNHGQGVLGNLRGPGHLQNKCSDVLADNDRQCLVAGHIPVDPVDLFGSATPQCPRWGGNTERRGVIAFTSKALVKPAF